MEEVLKSSPEFEGVIRQIEQALNDIEAITEQHRPSIVNEKYYTGKDVCKALQISKRTLQNYRDDGTLPFTKIGEKILYKVSDIQEILERNLYPAFKEQ